MKKKLVAMMIVPLVFTQMNSIAEAKAKENYQLKKHQLVSVKTGKIVKGYKLYKGKLYKNGKLNRGYAKVKIGSKLKLYYNAKLKKGYKTTNGKTLLFYNGELARGWKQSSDQSRLYKNGTLEYKQKIYRTTKNVYLYKQGYLARGLQETAYQQKTVLFQDGRLKKGAYVYKNRLFVNGQQNIDFYLYKGILYDGSTQASGFNTYKNLYYYHGQLANVIYQDVQYVDGKPIVYTGATKALEQANVHLQGILQDREIYEKQQKKLQEWQAKLSGSSTMAKLSSVEPETLEPFLKKLEMLDITSLSKEQKAKLLKEIQEHLETIQQAIDDSSIQLQQATVQLNDEIIKLVETNRDSAILKRATEILQKISSQLTAENMLQIQQIQQSIEQARKAIEGNNNSYTPPYTPPVNQDLQALQQLVNGVTGTHQKDGSIYTINTWKIYQNALADAQQVLATKDNSQYVSALNALNSAIKGLQTKASKAKEDLSVAVTQAGQAKRVESNYTTSSWKDYDAALTEAQSLIAGVESTEAVYQAAQVKLTTAISGLKTKSLESAQSLMQAILNNQQQLQAGVTQAQLDAAYNAIQQITEEQSDKSALLAQHQKAQELWIHQKVQELNLQKKTKAELQSALEVLDITDIEWTFNGPRAYHVKYVYKGSTYEDNLALMVIETVQLKQNPTKGEYNLGETLDLSGLQIDVMYADHTSGILTGQNIVTNELQIEVYCQNRPFNKFTNTDYIKGITLSEGDWNVLISIDRASWLHIIKVHPVTLTSKSITNLNFTDTNPQIQGTFGAPKPDNLNFTINYTPKNQSTIPIVVTGVTQGWVIDQDAPNYSIYLEGLINSYVQDEYKKLYPTDWWTRYDISAWHTGDSIILNGGQGSKIEVVEPSGSNIFNTSVADGKHSYQFTVTDDNSKSTIITLDRNFATFDDLVNEINAQLQKTQVNATAAKASSTTFTIRGAGVKVLDSDGVFF